MADLNLLNGHGTAEDEFDSSYLDKDSGAVHFEPCAASPKERKNDNDNYLIVLDATAASYEASETEFV